MTTIEVPDFPYSGHYYAEILEDLIRFLRSRCPELSDEDDAEPHIQLLRAFALSGHNNNANLDLVANEMFLPTAKLRSSVRNLLALINVDLAQAAPATADILYALTRTFSATALITPMKSLFATVGSRTASSIEYEVLADVQTIRTDQVDKVYYQDSVGSFTDVTASAIATNINWTPWSGVAAGKAIYVGHRDVLWDQINIVINASGSQISEAVWEYYDGNFDQGNPTAVSNLGDRLRFNINSILGTTNRAGTIVRVRSAATGAYADLTSTWDTGSSENRIETIPGSNAFLGQGSPSTTAIDYIVGTAWRELADLTDGTSKFTAAPGDKSIQFTLPQTLLSNWRRTLIGDGSLAFTAYWIRFRVIAVGGSPVAPTLRQVRIHDRKQYQVIQATQGRSREDKPLGSSDGTANQTFQLLNFPVIDDNNLHIYVTESAIEREYTRVDNFLSSTSIDRHFTIEYDDDGIATIGFGDGTNGKIPPAGVGNLRATYRTMIEIDGNVGANTITVNRSGIAHITGITNPRPASGFAAREGGTDESLAALKISGPATLRIRERAVGPGDLEAIAITFVASDGSKPIKRALAIEEAFGPKTVEVVSVGAGGQTIISTLLTEFQDYLNGTPTTRGVLLLNTDATVSNFTPKTVAITATVEGGSLSAILTALTGLINPLATASDGSFQWSFGGEVPRAKIIQAIMNTDPPPTDMTLTTPSSDVTLGIRELPVPGTFTITVI